MMMTQAILAGVSGAVLATAIAAHGLNRAYCDYLGDDSQMPWDEAPDWQKESAIKGVQFHLDNPEASPSASHDSWMAQKLSDGWVYGEVKDEEKKTHPCIVSFDRLPSEQQLKDVLFRAQVHTAYPLLKSASDEIERLRDIDDGGEGEIATIAKERDDAIERAERAEKKLSATKKAVKAKDAEAKPRKFSIEPNTDAVTGDEEKARRDDLRAKLQGAESVEIVQVDSKGKEIPGSTPFHVAGDVWKDHLIGVMLDQPVDFRGGEAGYSLAGFALLIDGKHVATQVRSDPLTVNPGQQVKLVNDIAF